jgi:predicted RecA/RadA family phage recombinase
MSIELLTPFSMVTRRTAIKGANDVLTGRWVQLDGTNKVTAAVDPTKGGSYLVMEGNLLHTGGPTDFTGAASTVFTRLPSVDAVGALGIAYGVFRYHVGAEGVLQSDAFTVGAPVYLDSAGRVTLVNAGSAIKVGVIEALVGSTAAWTDITIRTVSQ